MHQLYLQCRHIVFFLPFIAYIIRQCEILDVRPCASSYILLLSIVWRDSSILLGGLPRCLSLCWDFFGWAWFWELFSFFWRTYFFSFLFFYLGFFNNVRSLYFLKFLIFHISKRSDSLLIWQYYSLSYLYCSIFFYKYGKFIYANFQSCILSVLFFANSSMYMYIRWLNFSCDFLHFVASNKFPR